jgi:hypothetical protein
LAVKAFLGLLLLLGFVVVYWKLTLALLIFWAVVKAAPIAYREHQTERQDRRARAEGLSARADQQVRWWHAGDERAIYGENGRMEA